MSRPYRSLLPTLGVAAVGAAVAFASAVPATAAGGATHRSSATHQVAEKHHHHSKHLMVKGLVAAHHGRTVTVFAKTAKAGAKTRHNKRIKIVFTRSAHGRTRIPVGDHLRLKATGTASKHVFRIRHNDDEQVTEGKATLIFGTVSAVNGNQLTVSENDRDNGDHHDGDDNDGENHGGDNNRVSPADHSPGGPGDGGGDNDGRGHRITVDDTTAAISVDGTEGAIDVGDTVAILGEVTDNTVVASTIYAFSTPQGFLRGKVQSVSGDNVTFRNDGNTMTVSLTNVPLALNGDVGATSSELVAGDKLLLVGPVDASTGDIMPNLAFAFNDNDDHPCGDNDGHHHHGGDGGTDG
jgi:hypothetical protein